MGAHQKLVLIVAAILGIIAAYLVSTTLKGQKLFLTEKQEFMDECLQERKKYECTYMWRSGW